MKKTTLQFTTHSPVETIKLGQRIGRILNGGQVIALVGNLGTGKNHLIQGIADVLGVNQEDVVTSPTFVLVNEYFTSDGRQVYHIDAYRLESVGQFESLGIEEYLRPDSIVLVEWADRVWQAMAPLEPLLICLEHGGGDRRRIRVENAPAAWVNTLNEDLNKEE